MILLLAVGVGIYLLRSKSKQTSQGELLDAPTWPWRINALNMVAGPIVILFGGMVIGSVSIGHLLVAILLFFGGLSAKRYFQPNQTIGKTGVAITNLIGLFLGIGVVLSNDRKIHDVIRSSDQAFSQAIAVIPSALCVSVTLITLVVLFLGPRASEGQKY